ncbi:hypothetical protein BRADI_4g28342v3 [Brachypodium distachyon]|uniref:Secreted protein n=1 Tax=Brachypodium distachyon TaxID=15368 RepID=A0A2K2CQW9_BRADI|nr:hypothetical protein BRADI_4g28342v3 [Brachypodium distachyon]
MTNWLVLSILSLSTYISTAKRATSAKAKWLCDSHIYKDALVSGDRKQNQSCPIFSFTKKNKIQNEHNRKNIQYCICPDGLMVLDAIRHHACYKTRQLSVLCGKNKNSSVLLSTSQTPEHRCS